MFAYVGGYTSADRQGRSPGISVYRVWPDEWEAVQTIGAENPSLLRTGPGGGMLYAGHGVRTTVSAYAIDAATGLLSPRGAQDSGGVNPVDLGVWPGRDHLLVANYTGATLALLPLAADGALLPATAVLPLRRPGHPDPAMPHGVTFDPSGRFALVPDKGLDCVFVFTLGSDGALQPAGFGVCAPGSGPRHCVFHPALPVLYVVNELDNTVQSFRWNTGSGALHPLQVCTSLPPGAPASFAAEIGIALDGRSLYASNRGDDSIARFAIDAAGILGPAECTPCGGATPRLFTLSPDGGTLHVVNQGSDQIVSFPLDVAGRLGAGRVVAEVGSPTALCFGGGG